MRPGLINLLSKHAAALAPTPKNQEFLDNHFTETNPDKWKAYRQKLRSPAFVESVRHDERADSKLKRFSKSLHQHYTGKGPTIEAASQTSSKKYLVKYHPEQDQFSCGCGDWVHSRSTKTGAGRECKHIKAVKTGLRGAGAKSLMTES